jgi:hypothetical protein
LNNSDPRTGKLKTLVVCLLAATFFWLMNALNKDNYSFRLNYPINFVYNDSAYIPVQPLPSNVSVNVSGDGWNLLRKSWFNFNARPVEYRINNPLTANAINSTSLTDQITEHFPNLRVNYVVADTFELGFDRRASKVITVRADSLGIDMRDGYVISSFINLSPARITISGPASIIQQYPDTLLLKVPARRIQNNYDESLPVALPAHPQVQSSHDRILVSFEVAQLLRPLPPAP